MTVHFQGLSIGVARFVLACCCISSAGSALADEPSAAGGIPDPSIATSLPQVLADPGGQRAALASRGIQYGINYIGEVYSNRKGGIERGTVYDGRLELYVDADLEKNMGLRGLAFHANGYQIHGESIAAEKVGTLNAISSIEATPATRLFEMWLEQKLFDDTLSVRFGQLAVDSEFMLADGAGQFLNGSLGWPTIAAPNLPNGGAAYPFAAPGVRVEYAPSDQVTLRVGVYNDDPVGPCAGDPQVCNAHGLDFRLKDEPFIIGEAVYKYNRAAGSPWLPGTLKIGGFADLGTFDDQRFDSLGLSLADPASSGTPLRHGSDQAFYAVVDQQLYASASGSESVSMFARFMVAPTNRNLVDLYVDGGVVLYGLVPGRPKDLFGIAAAYARVSDDAKALDRDAASFGSLSPVRRDEALMELSYIAEVIPGFTVQPDIQYVWNPGGGAPDDSGTKRLDDAVVIGIRTSLNY